MFDNQLFYYLIVLSFILLIGYFLLSKKPLFKTDSRVDLQIDHLVSYLQKNGGNHLSHLILLQDKNIYWACKYRVLIAYRRIGNKLVVLGDPIGEEPLMLAAMEEFHEYCKSKRLKPIFYQVSPHFMHHYHEMGYSFLKLGEEGSVNLQNFSLEGKQGAKLRTRINKFTRNSFTFSVVKPPYSSELLSELRTISDSWLGNQKEKGFSVVSFSEEYVSCFPIALLFDPAGKIIAFSTLATDYRKTLTIDLMRKSIDSPHGTMDVLFIQIFKWAKENGFHRCSLGMAPLANVGSSRYSFKSEKLLRLAYLNGNSLYKFQGLRDFKSKFACTWEPKYLAYKKTILPVVIIQLLLLINNQPHPNYVVKKIKYLLTKAG